MQMPLEGKPELIDSESKKLEAKFLETSKINPVSLDNVFVQLKNIYGQESEVIFSKKSTAHSQVTCNLVLCGA
jgi:hypothetical protein